MPIRRPRGPKPALRHVEFLDSIAAAQQAPAATAGLLTLRLFEAWLLHGSHIVAPDARALVATRDAIAALGKDLELQQILSRIVATIVRLREPDAAPVLPHFLAYAELLTNRNERAHAAAVLRDVVRSADATAHAGIAIEAALRLGRVELRLGRLDDASRAFDRAATLASRRRDRVQLLWARIGEALVLAAHGDLAAADAALARISTEAAGLGNPSLHAASLYEGAAVALLRNDPPRAARLTDEARRSGPHAVVELA